MKGTLFRRAMAEEDETGLLTEIEKVTNNSK